jgi:hypothetical protein
VFHHTTEYLITGILIAPTIPKIAVARETLVRSSLAPANAM